jgi:hypothetical protein
VRVSFIFNTYVPSLAIGKVAAFASRTPSLGVANVLGVLLDQQFTFIFEVLAAVALHILGSMSPELQEGRVSLSVPCLECPEQEVRCFPSRFGQFTMGQCTCFSCDQPVPALALLDSYSSAKHEQEAMEKDCTRQGISRCLFWFNNSYHIIDIAVYRDKAALWDEKHLKYLRALEDFNSSDCP